MPRKPTVPARKGLPEWGEGVTGCKEMKRVSGFLTSKSDKRRAEYRLEPCLLSPVHPGRRPSPGPTSQPDGAIIGEASIPRFPVFPQTLNADSVPGISLSPDFGTRLEFCIIA